MTRATAIGIIAATALALTGCHAIEARPSALIGRVSVGESATWTDAQRREFNEALAAAREALFERIRQARVGPDVRVAALVGRGVVDNTELRNLVATAQIRRVTWLADGRCRVSVGLGLNRLASALDRWDRQGKWAPHSQVLALNRPGALESAAESGRDG